MHQFPLVPSFRYIQRLKSNNKDPKIKMSERFDFDYMGNSYFEDGSQARAIRHLNTYGEIHEFKIGETTVYCLYSTICWTPDSVEEKLTELAEGRCKSWVEETPYFSVRSISEIARRSKRPDWKDLDVGDSLLDNESAAIRYGNESVRAYDAWLESHAPMFWTVRPINMKDLKKNFANSVAEMDRRKAAATAAASVGKK